MLLWNHWTGLEGPDRRNRIRLRQWKISEEREGFMHTGFSTRAFANKVSGTKSMRFQSWSPTSPWPHLNFAPSRAYMIMPLICLPCIHAYGAHIASNSWVSDLLAMHACNPALLTNKKKERKERKSSMNSMHLWFHGWQGNKWVVSLFPIFYFALTVTSHHNGRRIVS
jgi:hypothetical protein